MRCQSAIVLFVLGQGGFIIGKLRRVGLVSLGEELLWLGDIIKLSL